MGSPPPVDFPPPDQQASASVDLGFQPSPSGALLCGFGLPLFLFNASFRLTGFPPFAFPPTFAFFIGLNCDASKPIDASFSFGGGRKPNIPPSGDAEDVP